MTIKESEINVVVLPDLDNERESLRQACFDILKTCKTRADYVALLNMALEDSRTVALREVATKKIQMLAKALIETEK